MVLLVYGCLHQHKLKWPRKLPHKGYFFILNLIIKGVLLEVTINDFCFSLAGDDKEWNPYVTRVRQGIPHTGE